MAKTDFLRIRDIDKAEPNVRFTVTGGFERETNCVMSTPAPLSTVRIRLLLVEDRPLDAELILDAVQQAGYTLTSAERVETPEGFLRELAQTPDVILCDYSMPGFSALAALKLMQEQRADIPFIIVSGSIGEETAVEAIKAGADDYLLKDRLGRLGSAIAHALAEKQLRFEANQAAENLRQSEIKYRCLFEHLPEAAYLCDAATGRIIDTNPRGESMLGLERSELLGMRLSHFLPETDFLTLRGLADAKGKKAARLTSEVTGDQRRHTPVTIEATVVVIANHQLLLAFLRAAGS